MLDMPQFTTAVMDKAAALLPPEQIGSFVWHVLGSTGEIRKVQTNARIRDDDVYLTFLTCSCPAGSKTRIASCSHVLKVLQAQYLDRFPDDQEDDDGTD